MGQSDEPDRNADGTVKKSSNGTKAPQAGSWFQGILDGSAAKKAPPVSPSGAGAALAQSKIDAAAAAKSGGGGSGGGSGATGPTAMDSKAIITQGMQQYLGRKPTAKEVKAFFADFSQFSSGDGAGTGSSGNTQFLEDWIKDDKSLNGEREQFDVNTTFMDVLNKTIKSMGAL